MPSTTTRRFRPAAMVGVGVALTAGLVATTLAAPAKSGTPTAATPTIATAPAAIAGLSTSAAAVQERGVVTTVADGDTFLFRANGTGSETKIRMLGLNAPEVGSGGGKVQCGSAAAEDLLTSLIPPGSTVELRSISASSKGRGRPLRYVYAKDASGAFTVDVQQKMLASGLALFFGHKHEAANSRALFQTAEEARLAGRGLWNPTYCGVGPSPNAQLSLQVNWDAPGNDGRNPNGEYAILRNTGSSPVSLGGWTLRDSSLYWYVIPGGTTIKPGKTLLVKTGKGRNTARVLHRNRPKPVYPNTTKGATFVADGAYLLDPIGNIRAAFTYPCVVGCADPAQGKVKIKRVVHTPKPSAPRNEKVVIKNKTRSKVYLRGYYLRLGTSTYTLRPNTRIKPRGKLTVRMGKGKSRNKVQVWGSNGFLLKSKGKMELRSLRDVPISTKSWGGRKR